MTQKSESDKWYCLGTGPVSNLWYPFDLYINQKIDEFYQSKSESFSLSEGSPMLQIRFESSVVSLNSSFESSEEQKNSAKKRAVLNIETISDGQSETETYSKLKTQVTFA